MVTYRAGFLAVITVVFVAGCSSSTGTSSSANSSATPPLRQSSAASAPPGQPALVGEWQRLQKCAELERVVKNAGLQQRLLVQAVAGDGWIPGVSAVEQIKDPAHPCVGAKARLHSHFFTADGQFGSRDAVGQQVDDGHYRLAGQHTLIIDKFTFHYTITGGDTLALTPVLPKCAPGCDDALWTVSVAFAGYTWHRIG